MEDLRKQLYAKCLMFIETRLDTANTALQQAQDAANDDTKSSAGDKFETTREMMQQEIDRNKKLLFDAQQQQNMLQKLENTTITDIVKPGSIVFTNLGNFFISISAGQLQQDGKIFFAVSPVSPIALAFLGKKLNDTVSFNGKSFSIERLG